MLWKEKSSLLKDVYMHLYEQIHPSRNIGLDKETLDYDSYKKIWWLCKCGREWQQIVCLRSVDKLCPTCLKNKVNPEKLKINLPIIKSRTEIENYWIQTFSIPAEKIPEFRNFVSTYTHEEMARPIARKVAKKGTISERIIGEWLGLTRRVVSYWKNKKV